MKVFKVTRIVKEEFAFECNTKQEALLALKEIGDPHSITVIKETVVAIKQPKPNRNETESKGTV